MTGRPKKSPRHWLEKRYVWAALDVDTREAVTASMRLDADDFGDEMGEALRVAADLLEAMGE